MTAAPTDPAVTGTDAAPTGAARDTGVVAVWTAVSRVSGLARLVVIAAVLGASHFGNLYQGTNLLPNILFEFLTGPLIASLIVPAIVGYIDTGRRDDVHRITGGFLGSILVAFAAVAVVVIAAGPLVLGALTLGVPDTAVSQQYTGIGWLLFGLLIPQVLLYAVVGTAVAVQNASGRFAFPAAAPLIENVGIMATLVAYAVVFGTGTPLAEVHAGHLLLLGVGTTSAVGLHAAAQWWGAKRAGVRLVPRIGWRDPQVRGVLALAIPSLGYAMSNAARQFGGLIVGSSIQGGVVAFQLAMSFYNLPVALGGRPVAQATLPRLARANAQDQEELATASRRAVRHSRRLGRRYRQTLAQALAMSMVLTVPAAVGLATLAEPLSVAVSYGQMRAMGGTALVAGALFGLAAGVVGETAFILGTQASYARRNAKVPLRIAMLRTGVTAAIMAYCLLAALQGSTLMAVLGLAITAGDLVAAACMWLYLRVRARHPFGVRTELLSTVASAGLLAATVTLLVALQDPLTGTVGKVPAAVLVLALSTVGGAAGYTLTQYLLGSQQVRDLMRLARPARNRPKGAPQ